MNHLVSITSAGQMTIPKSVLRTLGIKGPAKAFVRMVDETLIVTPKRSFDSLAGSLSSKIKLSDTQLRAARNRFSRQWPRTK